MDAFYFGGDDVPHYVQELFCSNFAPFVSLLQTILKQEVTADSKYIEDSGCEALLEVRWSISEYEVDVKLRLDRLMGGAFTSAGSSAAILEAEGTCGTSGTGLSKYCLL